MEIQRLKTQEKKGPKRSPLTLSVVVLVIGTICILYIFSIRTKQNNLLVRNSLRNFDRVVFESYHDTTEEQLCRNSTKTLDLEYSPYLHFPRPQTFKREECECNPVSYFAIVSMQRSGSGWFETLLNSHENLSSNGEIFGARRRRNNVSVIYSILDEVYNLDWLSSASKNQCTAAVGFKWMLNQGLMEYDKEIAEYMVKRGVSLVFLFRRNLLRRMVSLLANSYDKDAKLLNGTHQSHVHSPLDAQILARYKPALNVTVVVSSLRSAERMIAKALECFKTTRHILLYYEDILTNPTVKIHSGPLSSHISNFDEVRDKLKGTSYEKFINPDDYHL